MYTKIGEGLIEVKLQLNVDPCMSSSSIGCSNLGKAEASPSEDLTGLSQILDKRS
jgi:hypothetical protein